MGHNSSSTQDVFLCPFVHLEVWRKKVQAKRPRICVSTMVLFELVPLSDFPLKETAIFKTFVVVVSFSLYHCIHPLE